MIVPTYETTAKEQEIIINNQRKEIERLKEELENTNSTLSNMSKRIIKAIEYIEKHFQTDEGIVCEIIEENTCERNEYFIDNLLKILKGDKND